MKNFITITCLLFVTLFSVENVTAQSLYDPGKGCVIGPDGNCIPNTIITALPFLRIVPDARSGGMGDVGIAISADANAMHFNSSKLVFAEDDLGVSATYTPWLRSLGLSDVYLTYLSGFRKLDDQQAVGASIRYFSLGEINFTDINGTSTGTGNPNELEVALAYSRKLTDNFSASIAGKYLFSNLASGQQVNNVDIRPAHGGAADISVTYKTDLDVGQYGSDLTIGAAISNIGTKVTYTRSVDRDFIPANLGIGAAWDYRIDDFNTITFALDINKLLVPTPCTETDENGESLCDQDPEDGVADYKQQGVVSSIFSSFGDAQSGSEELQELMFSMGIEYWYDKQFAIRAGYYSEHRLKGNRRFFTVGLGLKYNVFGLNFSYLVPTTNQRNPLDNTLRFSLLFDFGGVDVE